MKYLFINGGGHRQHGTIAAKKCRELQAQGMGCWPTAAQKTAARASASTHRHGQGYQAAWLDEPGHLTWNGFWSTKKRQRDVCAVDTEYDPDVHLTAQYSRLLPECGGIVSTLKSCVKPPSNGHCTTAGPLRVTVSIFGGGLPEQWKTEAACKLPAAGYLPGLQGHPAMWHATTPAKGGAFNGVPLICS